jgi:hypothetical protein
MAASVETTKHSLDMSNILTAKLTYGDHKLIILKSPYLSRLS